MSLFSGIRKVGGKLLGGLGDVAKFAAPALALTGVGAPLAAGIGLAGGLAGQLNDKHGSLGQGLVQGGLSAAGSLGAGALRGSGLASKAAGALGLRSMPSSAAAANGAAPAAGLNLGGFLGSAAKWLGKNPEVAMLGLGALQNARTATQASGLRGQAVDLARADMASREPFRQLALAQLTKLANQTHTVPNLPVDVGNPFTSHAAY